MKVFSFLLSSLFLSRYMFPDVCAGCSRPSDPSYMLGSLLCIPLLIHMPLRNKPIKYIENFTTKKWKLSDKNSDIFHISAQIIDCGYSLEPPRQGSFNEYSQSMFWAEISKLMYTPVYPSFTIEKWGLWGSTLYRMFSWWFSLNLQQHNCVGNGFTGI